MAKKEKRPRQRTTTIHDISDDTLDLILQRITSLAVLVRAAATCKLWRRVIGDAGFLRRFRRFNGPNILGQHVYYSNFGSGTFFVSSPAPAAGEIVAIIGDISDRVSLKFLPCSSVLHDSRGGLLASSSTGSLISVSNPWTQATRKQRMFTCPMPTACKAGGFVCCTVILGVFLLDADPDDTGLNLSNFRALCVELRQCRHGHDGGKTNVQVRALVYSQRDSSWLQLGSMVVGDITFGTMTRRYPPFELVGRAGGSIIWCTSNSNNNVVLQLDESSGEFSRFTLPDEYAAGVNQNKIYHNRLSLRVVGGDAGTVHLVRIVGSDLEVLRYARGGGGECVVERKVRVPHQVATIDVSKDMREYYGRRRFVDDTAEAASPGCVVLCDNHCEVEYVWMFSGDTRNLELQRTQKLSRHSGRAFPYELPWTISACL